MSVSSGPMAKKKKAKSAKKATRRPAKAIAKKARKAKAAPARKVAKSARSTRSRSAKARAPKSTAKAMKKATAKPKAKARPSAKAKAASPKAEHFQRRDGGGHLDPRYEAELRSRSDRPTPEPDSFIERARSTDDLVEGLGEEFVAGATTGEYGAEDKQNQEVTEEIGGPFVETTAGQEFARGIDASNPKGSTREPFPRT
jgi:hypothetical protein